MYNRYIPQSDGSYRKNQIPEKQAHTHPQPSRPNPKPEPTCPPPSQDPCPPPEKEERKNCPPPSRQGGSAASFLQQLFPRDLDTGDLLVIILLLLMAGDCKDDKNTAFLTLALYLFM